MKRKTRKRLAKEAALAKAEARGDFSHLKDKKGNLKAEPLRQPTLPNVDFDDVDDEKLSQFHAYPPGHGLYPPPPPMTDFGGSDFYHPRPQHGYTPSVSSNDRGWGGMAPLGGQSSVSLVPNASNGSDVGIDYPPLPGGSYGPPSYHSERPTVSRSQTYASRPPPTPSPEARHAAIYAALDLPNGSGNKSAGGARYGSPPPSEGMRGITHTQADPGALDYFSYGQRAPNQQVYVQDSAGYGDGAKLGGGGDIADFYDAYSDAFVPQYPQQQQQSQPSSHASAYEPPSRTRLLERTLEREDDRVISVTDSIGAESDFGDIYARADPGHHRGGNGGGGGGGGPMDRRWQR
jgi:hypothetical protein